MNSHQLGLVLTGGGSRGAYQAGCMKALAEIASSLRIEDPFPIVTGVSAGAINASFWASYCDNPLMATTKLCSLWENLSFDQVFTTGVISMTTIASRLIRDVSLAPILGNHSAESLLDTSPLKKLIENNIDFSKIQNNIERGHLKSLAVTATDFGSNNAVTFVQGREPIQMWERKQRQSQKAKIGPEHVMASSALPLFFPPIAIGDRYFGDGALRNIAPLSPAIHLGADRLLIIGVRKQPPESEVISGRPSIARVLSVVLNSILLDGVDWDIERMTRANRSLQAMGEEKQKDLGMKLVEFLWLYPSQDLGRLAQIETRQLPRTIRFLIKGLGPLREASGIASYLLFDPVFCGQLIEMGYNDTMKRKIEVERFFEGYPM
jgi:NTE family protein